MKMLNANESSGKPRAEPQAMETWRELRSILCEFGSCSSGFSLFLSCWPQVTYATVFKGMLFVEGVNRMVGKERA